MNVATEDYRWLLSAAAELWLRRVEPEKDLAALAPRLRKELSAERAHLVVEQIDLRRRARDKFSRADQMFFTRKGFEQATDEPIAAYKARRFEPGQPVVDLCCGIGGDLIALAGGRMCAGVDADEICGLLAAHNCQVYGVQPSIRVARIAQDFQFPDNTAWHIDPDRRATGRRGTALVSFEPPLDVLSALLAHNPHAALKLAPASEIPAEWAAGCEREWISSRGECRQQVVWSGSFARRPVQRAATVVGRDGEAHTITGSGDEPIPSAASLGRYLYEPDAAVLAAKLTGALCAEHLLAAIAPGIAYLTADSLVSDGAVAAFEVQDVLPFDLKQLKAYCRESQIGRLEVKKRGVEINPEKVRRAVIGEGDHGATLIVTRLDGKTKAICANRLRGQ